MDKIIEVDYITNSDMGVFTTKAMLNLATGYVYDIEPLEDEAIEEMNTVHSENVSFVLDHVTYDFEVSYVIPEVVPSVTPEDAENADGYYIRDYKQSPLYQYLILNDILSEEKATSGKKFKM